MAAPVTASATAVETFPPSPDGTKIIFESSAANLAPGDTNGDQDIFINDLASGAITRVSVTLTGARTWQCANRYSFSPDGPQVAFVSGDANLVPGSGAGAGNEPSDGISISFP